MDKLAGYIVLAILAIAKLMITGICLAVGFKLGYAIIAFTEKKTGKRLPMPVM